MPAMVPECRTYEQIHYASICHGPEEPGWVSDLHGPSDKPVPGESPVQGGVVANRDEQLPVRY